MDELRREVLLAAEQPWKRLDDRDPRTERRPRLTELNADHAAAQNDQPGRYRTRGRRHAVRPRLRLGETGDRRHRGLGSGRDHDRQPRLDHGPI